jgi:hypothetical protein
MEGKGQATAGAKDGKKGDAVEKGGVSGGMRLPGDSAERGSKWVGRPRLREKSDSDASSLAHRPKAEVKKPLIEVLSSEQA